MRKILGGVAWVAIGLASCFIFTDVVRAQAQAPAPAQTSPAPAAVNAGGVGAGTETGIGTFQTHCMGCHGNADVPQAPAPDAIRQMTPERIYDALTTGLM